MRDCSIYKLLIKNLRAAVISIFMRTILYSIFIISDMSIPSYKVIKGHQLIATCTVTELAQDLSYMDFFLGEEKLDSETGMKSLSDGTGLEVKGRIYII